MPEIAELIVSALNLDMTPEQIEADAPLFGEGLGLDSIDILEVALVISKRYGFQLRSDDEDNVRIFSSLRRSPRTSPRTDQMRVGALALLRGLRAFRPGCRLDRRRASGQRRPGGSRPFGGDRAGARCRRRPPAAVARREPCCRGCGDALARSG